MTTKLPWVPANPSTDPQVIRKAAILDLKIPQELNDLRDDIKNSIFEWLPIAANTHTDYSPANEQKYCFVKNDSPDGRTHINQIAYGVWPNGFSKIMQGLELVETPVGTGKQLVGVTTSTDLVRDWRATEWAVLRSGISELTPVITALLPDRNNNYFVDVVVWEREFLSSAGTNHKVVAKTAHAWREY